MDLEELIVASRRVLVSGFVSIMWVLLPYGRDIIPSSGRCWLVSAVARRVLGLCGFRGSKREGGGLRVP